jgi:predicted O-methyltransferase YrrM
MLVAICPAVSLDLAIQASSTVTRERSLAQAGTPVNLRCNRGLSGASGKAIRAVTPDDKGLRVRRSLKRLAYRFGYDFTFRKLPQYDITRRALGVERDMEPEFVDMFQDCAPYTLTSPERMYALYQGVKHVVARDIPGEFVECGVWRGGSCMLMAKTLLEHGAGDRTIRLYDTFTGMTEPGEVDRRAKDGSEQLTRWQANQRDDHNEWAYAPLDEVRRNMSAIGYPEQLIHYVVGEVEKTLPDQAPEQIALLRLDTDWYSSTYHELVHLYPRLAPGGILVLDDYGSFEGARKAVDQYFEEQGIKMLLSRIDATGRIGVKDA